MCGDLVKELLGGVHSVPLFCWDVMELRAAARAGSTARPKNRKAPTTCWLKFCFELLLFRAVSDGGCFVR